MPTLVFTDGFVQINAVDLSDHVKSVVLDTGIETQDDTVMGDDTRSSSAGLSTWGVEIEFLQDYAASSVDATISPIVGTVVAIEIRPTSATVSSTNPKRTGNGLVASYNPVAGTVGDQAMASVSITSSGTLTRATS